MGKQSPTLIFYCAANDFMFSHFFNAQITAYKIAKYHCNQLKQLIQEYLE